MTSISPAVSLRSCESNLSSCSEFSVEANPDRSDRHHENGFHRLVQVNGFQQSNNVMKRDQDMSDGDDNYTSPDSNSLPGQSHEPGDTNLDQSGPSLIDDESGISLGVDELNGRFWEPPEPDDYEEDVEGRVSDYDDDDADCGDNTVWTKPTSLGDFGEEKIVSSKFKVEKQKAMEESMNGKFKSLVSHLLKLAGVLSSETDGNVWIGVITSLSWEAAKFVRPGFTEGNAMDPDGYVKIKCVATGSPQDSHVVKGLVFKKHAAHKHMPTRYKNPRLLLIGGALGLSTNGLSSFESMQQEKDSLKAISDVLDIFQPNVVLVEKTVARDIQESILAKGVTLVLDMKLHRLERISRCTGSPILSSDRLIGKKLWSCDSFHIEKFVEEHGSGEGGKRPSKTLMFVEGCPTRLGCTILLMGADSDQLKKIKCALRCAVVMAYHFILETYFLLDLKTMFSTMPVSQALNLTLNNQDVMSVVVERHTSSCNGECSTADSSMTCTTDIPISNGLIEESPQLLNPDWESNSSFSFGPYNPIFLSGLASLSSSLKRVVSDSFPLFSTPYPAMSVYFGVDEEHRDQETNSDAQIPISSSELIVNADEGDINTSLSNSLSTDDIELLDTNTATGDLDDLEDDHADKKDDIDAVLASESILVLMSSRNASRMTLCEHSHFSHIKFYRNFDFPLGKYLRENLLNQKLRCKTCSEPPEAHFYYYAHHNKLLTIQVRRLPVDKSLPGESEGKLWMWSRCGKCKSPTTSKISTRRVMISKAARGLSFGKFLELCFSNPSTFGTKSNCGHSLHKNFLYFFGLGTMVAMFKYSRVATYSVGLSPAKLDFGNSMNGTRLKNEFEKVYMSGVSMFLKLENILEELRPCFLGSTLNLPGSVKDFSYVEDLLKQERSQFEVDIQNTCKDENGDTTALKLVRLNRLRLELFLEAYIWDRRLRCLSKHQVVENREPSLHYDVDSKDIPIENGETLDISVKNGETSGILLENGEKVPSNSQPVEFDVGTSDEKSKEIHISEVLAGEEGVENGGSITYAAASENPREVNVAENLLPFVQQQSDKVYPVNTDSECSTLELNASHSVKSEKKLSFNLDNENDWVWTPFFEIRREYVKDVWRGNLPRFESLPSLYLDSTAQEAIMNESSRLHIPLGSDDYVVSDFEDEFSSIIACALALLKDVPCANHEADNLQSLQRVMSISTPDLTSNSSLDSEGSSMSTISSEAHYSSFDGLDFLDSLESTMHPEVTMGVGKSSGKRKYSVVCIYASQFRQLRNRCAYESGYIASLSRCRNWNAKGGKSNSVFCKTLDERFIIKEVQKTEFESFMKFAPNYFEYMHECHVLGNQTCLAKILGMYQVFIKSSKTGKESRHSLMVMENLSFGRTIARQYDLKGALHARFVSTGNGDEDVLLDQNFVNDMNVSPLYVSMTSKRNLQRAVWNDCTFLNSINVMDYSLLVGVDETKHELVCGIIDYLRQYTWDKQLETWAKISFVGRKNHQPTIISPIEYKKRFRKFIDTHFLTVPEDWCSQRSSNPCRLCVKRESDDDEDEDDDDDDEVGSSHSSS